MIRIEVTRQAASDRDEILDYYGKSSPRGDDFIASVNEAFRHLLRWPDSAGRRSDLTKKNVRFWLIAPYYLVLQREADVLIVVAILHCSRNISYELRTRLGKTRS